MEQTAHKTEVVYEYRHASGEVVNVISFEEALGKCAVLGVESPEKARLLFSLYARGVEKSSEETQETEEAEEPEVEEIKIETKREKETFDDKPQAKIEKLEKTEPKTSEKEIVTELELDKEARVEPIVKMSSVEQTIPTNDVVPEKPAVVAKKTESFIPPNHYTSQPPAIEESFNAAVPVHEIIVVDEAKTPQPEPEVFVQAEFQLPVVEAAEVQTAETKPPVTETNDKAALPKEKTETPIELLESEDEQTEYEFPIPDEVDIDRDGSLPIEVSDMETSTEDFPIPDTLEERPLLFVQEETEYEVISNELSVSFEEVETTIDQLTEKIDALEPEEAEAVHQTLDEIAELSKKLETSTETEAEVANEKEVREELIKLFIDLFDRVGIEFTPELIETFVNLAINHRLEEMAEVQAPDEAVEKLPKDRGTHEAITKILISLTAIKKALLRAYALGKSALNLYILENSPAY